MSVDGWVFAALCSWANKNGSVQVVKSGNRIKLFLHSTNKLIGEVAVERTEHSEG